MVYNSPGLDFYRSIVDSWNGLTTAQNNNEFMTKHEKLSGLYVAPSYVSMSPNTHYSERMHKQYHRQCQLETEFTHCL